MSVTISFSSTKHGKGKYPLEVDEQKACWSWLAGVHPHSDGSWGTHSGTADSDFNPLRSLQDFCYMVPNGTQLAGARTRRAMYMASLKAQGFRPGVSDIVIACPIWLRPAGQCLYAGAYIELKRDWRAYKGPAALKSALKPEQREWLRLMKSVGYWSAVAYGFEDFKQLVNSYMLGESPRTLDFIPVLEDTQGAQ